MDFTLESALLYISQTNPTTEQEFKNTDKSKIKNILFFIFFFKNFQKY